MYPVLGASLLSAAASLPLHLMPFLVATLVAESRLPVQEAGWVASAYMAGQLATALALPALGLAVLRAGHAALAAALLAVLPWVASTAPAGGLLASWFTVGAACGSLQFLGATTAAAAKDKSRAFALRLGAILLASSAVIVLLTGRSGFGSYEKLAVQLCAALTVLGAVGLALYRPPVPPSPAPAAAPHRAAQWGGLAAVFLLFAAQPGFWAYAVQSAQQRGLELEAMAYAIAASKVLSVLVLLLAIRRPRPADSALFWPGLAVSIGVLIMARAQGLPAFVVGVLLWELAVNLLSVRFQAAVVARAGDGAGPWLAATVFLGAAAGPALHGLAIQAHVSSLFIAFACAAGLIPYAWRLLDGAGISVSRGA